MLITGQAKLYLRTWQLLCVSFVCSLQFVEHSRVDLKRELINKLRETKAFWLQFKRAEEWWWNCFLEKKCS